jgi:hypothetical protein
MAGTTPGVRAAQLTSPTLPPFAFRSSTRDITMLLSHQRDVSSDSVPGFLWRFHRGGGFMGPSWTDFLYIRLSAYSCVPLV